MDSRHLTLGRIRFCLIGIAVSGLAACGGNIDEVISQAGGFVSAPNAATERTVSEAKPAEPDREPILTDEQKSQGISGRYACEVQTVSLEQNADEFVQFNPQAGIVYPGGLVQGKSIETTGSMLPIAAPRGSGIVTLDIASGTSGAVSRTLPVADHASVTQAMNDILKDYDALTPAKASFKMTEIQSAEQLSAEVQSNVSGGTFDMAAQLNFDASNSKSKLLVELKQEYFTMVFQTPEKPAQVFDASVSAGDLKRQMGPDNPPIYIASVTYGRLFYMLFESSASEEELRASISGAYRAAIEANASAKASYAKQLSETTVNSYALGGSASGALAASTALMDGATGVEAIWEFFIEDANFSPQSPGAPISFKLVSLADNTPVRLASSTTYDVKQCQLVTIGCDGVEGSTKVKDSCGVCGGKNACQSCSAKTETHGNDKVFIYIDLPKRSNGAEIRIKDLGVAQYYWDTLRCHHVKTESLKYTCTNGSWKRSGAIKRDAWCSSSGDWDQQYVRVKKAD